MASAEALKSAFQLKVDPSHLKPDQACANGASPQRNMAPGEREHIPGRHDILRSETGQSCSDSEAWRFFNLPAISERLPRLFTNADTGATSAEDIYRRLQACTGDGQRRSLEVEVAADVVARSQDRARIVADLLRIWKTKSAPEMRVALAKIGAMSIANSHI